MYRQIFFRYHEPYEYDSLSLHYQRTLWDKVGIDYPLSFLHEFSSGSLEVVLVQTFFGIAGIQMVSPQYVL